MIAFSSSILTCLGFFYSGSAHARGFHSSLRLFFQANAARTRFICPDGDHLTLVNVLRAYMAAAAATGVAADATGSSMEAAHASGNQGHGPAGEESSRKRRKKESAREGRLRAWCRQHFLNARSLKKAVEVYR